MVAVREPAVWAALAAILLNVSLLSCDGIRTVDFVQAQNFWIKFSKVLGEVDLHEHKGSEVHPVIETRFISR